jgi:hypothetical protein
MNRIDLAEPSTRAPRPELGSKAQAEGLVVSLRMFRKLENLNFDIFSDFELIPVWGCYARASDFKF